MSNDTVTLLCLLQGEPFDRVFDVTIATGELVSRLKRLIKEERRAALRCVDAADLTLWKVSIPLGDESTLRKLDLEGSQQGIRKLLLLDTIAESLSNLPSHHIHVIVQIHKRRTASPLSPPPPKKQRRNYSLADLTLYQELFRRISEDSPEASADYSDPANILTLPFPFRGTSLPTDRFPLNLADTFEYMGREKFKKIAEAVKSLEKGLNDIYIYGTIGYGKSYMLAALACYLFRKQKRVVYLPDCRALAQNFVGYVGSALLLAYSDDPDSQYEIAACNTVDELVDFCRNPVLHNDLRLYFIINQLNALDHEPTNTDEVTMADKDQARSALNIMTSQHYRIRSASANYQSALHMEQKQTNNIKIGLYGGLSEVEMAKWWDNFASSLPILQIAEKQQIEDLTGRIPLLLRPLKNNSSYQGRDFNEPEINTGFYTSWEIQQFMTFTYNFAAKRKGEWQEKEHVNWRAYVDLMRCCILQTPTLDTRVELFDHRFFYVTKDLVGRSTCGIAQKTMIGFLRSVQEDFFLSPSWLNKMTECRHNPSMLGFIIEQACLSSIAQKGLNIAGSRSDHGKMSTFIFRGPFPSWDEARGTARPVLFLPLAFNHKAIDGIAVFKDERNKTVVMIAIQITIAQHHSDSELAFFSEWREWSSYYINDGYKVTAEFLWITGDDSDPKKTGIVESSKRNLRNRAIELPQFTRIHLSISSIDVEIADHYTRARVLAASEK